MTLSFGKLALAATAFLALAGCAQNPVTGRQSFVMMSEAEELRVGKQGDAEIRKQYGAYDAPELQRYVERVGQKLAQKSHRAQIPYHFTVLDSPEINAFALPGGYVYVTRGILAYLNSEAELAAVLGHEIGHVTARHSVQQYSASQAANIGLTIGSLFVPELRSGIGHDLVNLLGNALLSGYGREHELEADRLGSVYLARSGYDPQAMVKVIGVLKNQELFDAEIAQQEGRQPRSYHGLFATHPDNDTRLQQVVGEARQYAQSGAAENRAEFLAHSDGLLYGDNPQQGVIRDDAFYHPDLGFALRFPQRWRIQNQPDSLSAKSPDGDAMIELGLVEEAQTPAEALRKTLRVSRFDELETTTINGLPAAIAMLWNQGRPFRAAAIRLHGKTFLLAGAAASEDAFSRHDAAINGTIRGFHAIGDDERKLARALTLKNVAVGPAATFRDFARTSPLGRNAEGILRLLNASYPAGEPAAGQTVKVVE